MSRTRGPAARLSGRPPSLVVLAGLPGTGKSTLARCLAERTGGIWLRVDAIEAAILRAGLPRSFETGLAAYLAAVEIAREHLRLGRAVVIDAVNGVEEARRWWRELAEECSAERVTVEVVCRDAAEHRRRVEARGEPTPPLPTPTWAEVLARPYAAWTEPTLVVDSTRPLEEGVERILRRLSEGR